MLTELRLQNFKGFRDATLKLGPLSLVIGANASGKSNLRDALRFIQGIARGYNLAEIIGGKYGEGGYREWSGLRGGTREICRLGTEEFSIHLSFIVPQQEFAIKHDYKITVRIDLPSFTPHIVSESLYVHYDLARPMFTTVVQQNIEFCTTHLGRGAGIRPMQEVELVTRSNQPALSQIPKLADHQTAIWQIRFVRPQIEAIMREMASMRFLEFVPDAMRQPSIPGQTLLSEQGENLSSVLQVICENQETKNALKAFIQELTPMDVSDFKFVPDLQGKIIVYLVEKNGSEISAYSASDGTLRFLGVLAALFGPTPAKFYFFEEIDTGIHPSRLYLLMNRLRERTSFNSLAPPNLSRSNVSSYRDLQVCLSTHSPQMLRLLDEKEFQESSLTYRAEGTGETRIKSLPEIPHLMEALKTSDIARLYEGGWMEQTMFYEEGEAEPFVLESDEKAAP